MQTGRNRTTHDLDPKKLAESPTEQLENQRLATLLDGLQKTRLGMDGMDEMDGMETYGIWKLMTMTSYDML